MVDLRNPAADLDPERLDWNDALAVAAWFSNLRTAWEDAAMVAADMLKPPRLRNLGPAEHARLHADASASMSQLLAYGERGNAKPL